MNFSFTKQGSQDPLSIRVPFALLNLTLESPLANEPISCFPCSPSDSFALGRAFLQAAFIGQNYNSSTFWLGQAPGPNGLDAEPVVKLIQPTDTSFVPNPTGMTWEQSWTNVLKSIPSSSSSNVSNQPSSGSTNLSSGAIAGIVIGVVVLTALVLVLVSLFLRRRRRQQQNATVLQSVAELGMPPSAADKSNETYNPLVEAPLPDLELDNSRPLAEAPGDFRGAEMSNERE